MPLSDDIQKIIYDYCGRDLADEEWYAKEFNFIKDLALKERIINEFKSIRFAYKMYEAIGATNVNLLFQIRCQILIYASIYEAVLQYVLCTYYNDSEAYIEMLHHDVPIRISIPEQKMEILKKVLLHDKKEIIPYFIGKKKKNETSIRFDDKCRTAEKLNLIGVVKDDKGEVVVDDNGNEINIAKDIIKIYEYRNGIHIFAEQRKMIQYELELSRKAYRRMRPFIDQIKLSLIRDGKYV